MNVQLHATNAYYINNNIDPATSTPAQDAAAAFYAEEVALVYFVGNYPTGLTILKADTNGIFQPLHFTATQISSTGTIIYSSSPCN